MTAIVIFWTAIVGTIIFLLAILLRGGAAILNAFIYAILNTILVGLRLASIIVGFYLMLFVEDCFVNGSVMFGVSMLFLCFLDILFIRFLFGGLISGAGSVLAGIISILMEYISRFLGGFNTMASAIEGIYQALLNIILKQLEK